MKTTKVLIADDHSIVRKGITALIASLDNMEVVGQAVDGKDTLQKVKELTPDLLLVDISMPELTGLEVLSHLRDEGSEMLIIILSMHNEEEYVLRALNSGANGYLLKNADDDEIAKGIQAVVNGETYYSNHVSQILINSLRKPTKKDGDEDLTSREKEVLGLIVEGLSNKEIADKAFISARTVDKHRAKIMKKIGARNAADLVRITLEKGLLKM